MNETKTPLTDKFIDDLIYTMKWKNLTKAELARYLGTRRQLVQSWMQANNRRSPSSEKLLMIQKWLKSLD